MPLSAWSSWRYDAQEKLLCNGTDKNKSAKSRSTIGYWQLQGLLFHWFLFFPYTYIYIYIVSLFPFFHKCIVYAYDSFKFWTLQEYGSIHRYIYRADLVKLRIKVLNPPSLPEFSLLPTFVHVQIQILEFISTYNKHLLNCELHVSV